MRARGPTGDHRQCRVGRCSFAAVANQERHARRPSRQSRPSNSPSQSLSLVLARSTFNSLTRVYTMAETSPRNQSQARRAPHSNHGRRRPRGRGGKGSAKPENATSTSASAPNARASSSEIENPTAQTQTDIQQDDSQDLDLCWICAEPIKYYAVSECNHRTCHVCALRLRALYKKLDCTFCKVRMASPLPSRCTFNQPMQGTTTDSHPHRLL